MEKICSAVSEICIPTSLDPDGTIFDKFLVHEQAHMGKMGKWPWLSKPWSFAHLLHSKFYGILCSLNFEWSKFVQQFQWYAFLKIKRYQIWQIFVPCASLYRASGQMTLILHNFRSKYFEQRKSVQQFQICAFLKIWNQPPAHPSALTKLHWRMFERSWLIDDTWTSTSYFFVFWHMQLYMSWYIRSFFGFTFLNILYFFKYSCTNIFL